MAYTYDPLPKVGGSGGGLYLKPAGMTDEQYWEWRAFWTRFEWVEAGLAAALKEADIPMWITGADGVQRQNPEYAAFHQAAKAKLYEVYDSNPALYSDQQEAARNEWGGYDMAFSKGDEMPTWGKVAMAIALIYAGGGAAGLWSAPGTTITSTAGIPAATAGGTAAGAAGGVEAGVVGATSPGWWSLPELVNSATAAAAGGVPAWGVGTAAAGGASAAPAAAGAAATPWYQTALGKYAIGTGASALGGFLQNKSAADAYQDYLNDPSRFNIAPDQLPLRSALSEKLQATLGSGQPVGGSNPLYSTVNSRMLELVSPGYWEDVTLEPEAWLNRISEGTRPAFQDDLAAAYDTERSKLGGQYGIRYGSDVLNSLGLVTERALNDRNAALYAQLPAFLQAAIQGRQSAANVALQGADWERTNRLDPYNLSMQFALGYPPTTPYSSDAGASGSGALLQTVGNSLAMYPLYESLYKKD